MPRDKAEARRPCCMISEFLEEAGLDRRKVRQVSRQVLEGIILLCRWQLERIEPEPARPPSAKKGRRVSVE